MIGEECDLLGIASPYTYICKKKTLCYTSKVETFYKLMLDLNPLGLEELKKAASQKLKEFCQMTRDKKDYDKEVANVDSIKRSAEKQEQRETYAKKHYPMGDKPLIYQICNIIQNKKDLGET